MRGDDTTRRSPAPGARQAEGGTALRAGETLVGRFEVRRLLGRGGMGAVYEAEDRELGVTVALKTLLPELVRNQEALRLLKREVLLARRVSHPNVCRLHDLGHDTDRGLLFCTTHYIQDHCSMDELELAFDTAYRLSRTVAQAS